jgi:hypothetical protein
MIEARTLRLAACVALALGAGTPAAAQFMTNYPVIIVPPPPAQNLILPPKPAPKPAQAKPSAPDATNAPAPIQCHYQGQTKVCS